MGVFSKLLNSIISNTGKKTEKVFRFGSPLRINTSSENFVDEEKLKTLPDIISIVRRIADDVAATNLHVNKVTYDNENGTRSAKLNKTNNITGILTRKMNYNQTPYKFLQMYIHHMFETGRFAAVIIKEAGIVKEIIPLDPHILTIHVDKEDHRYFRYGSEIILSESSVIFIPWEEAIGFSDVTFRVQFQAMLGMFADLTDLDSSLLANKTNFMGHIIVPEDLDIATVDGQKQMDQIREQYKTMVDQARTTGAGVMVTDAKWEYKQFNDSQSSKKSTLDSESHKDLIRQLSRAFKIPMSYLGYQEDSTTDANVTTLNYMKGAVQPWIRLLVAELNAKLYPNDLTSEISYDLNDLLKVSLTETAEAITKLANAGVMTINEMRTRYLDLPTVKYGDMILGNSTLIPVEQQAKKIKAEIKALNKPVPQPTQEKGGDDG